MAPLVDAISKMSRISCLPFSLYHSHPPFLSLTLSFSLILTYLMAFSLIPIDHPSLISPYETGNSGFYIRKLWISISSYSLLLRSSHMYLPRQHLMFTHFTFREKDGRYWKLKIFDYFYAKKIKLITIKHNNFH